MDKLLTTEQVVEYLNVSPKKPFVVSWPGEASRTSGLEVCYVLIVATCSGGFRPERRAEVPKLPRNMIKRKGRGGYYFRKRFSGRDVWISLGTDYSEAVAKLKKLRNEDHTPRSDVSVREAANHWLQQYIVTARNPNSR